MPLLTATSRTPKSVNLFCVGRTLMGKGVHSVGRRSRAQSRLWSIRLIRVELHGLGSATRQVSTKMMMPLRCSVNTHCHPVVRLHHKHGVQRCSLLCVCLYVCLLVTTVRPTKTAEPVNLLVGCGLRWAKGTVYYVGHHVILIVRSAY